MEYIKGHAVGITMLLVFIAIAVYIVSLLLKKTSGNNASNQNTAGSPATGVTQPTQNTTVNQTTTVQQKTSGFNLLLFIISSAAVILICLIIAHHYPNTWDAWFGSFAFLITIVSIALAIALKALGYKSSYWYWVLLLCIPIAVNYLEFRKNPIQEAPISSSSNETKVKPDTIRTEINYRLITSLEPYQQYRIDGLGPNEEVVISGTGENGLRLKQVQRTDSLGVPEIIPLILTPGQQFKAGERIVFTHTKGYSRPILKRFF